MVLKERKQDRDGIALLELLTMESFTPYKSMINVISILLPAVGWVAAATLVVCPTRIFVSELYLMLGGAKMWLIEFHILSLIMLYGLVTSVCGIFISGSYESPVLSHNGD